MNCEQVRKILEAFKEGRLSAEESRAARVHLASCAACASGLSLSDRMEILPALDDGIEPSEDFAARFHSRLRDRLSHPAGGRALDPWWRRAFAWGHPWKLAAASAFAALVITGIFLGRYSRRASGPSEYFELAAAEHLPLLQDMAVISNLDLLENFDTIENLPPAPNSPEDKRRNP
jgi:anti-sigma factor RsiW